MKQQTQYKLIPCRNPFNRVNRFMPYHWDLNIYRGCKHQCIYCFAQYSHKYLDDDDFFHHIYIKENIVESLEKKLNNKNWKHEVVNLGGITDSYQPAEKEYQIMPRILKLLIQYKTPAIICTKSSLILRDIELLKELHKVAGVQIACTITTLDQSLADQLEPNASPVIERIHTIKTLKAAGLTVGWHLMPIIPYLTATRNNLQAIFQMAQKCQIDYLIPGFLNLRGNVKTNFFHFINNKYPFCYHNLWKLYHDKKRKDIYKKQLYDLIEQLKVSYQIDTNYWKYVPKNRKLEQLQLF